MQYIELQALGAHFIYLVIFLAPSARGDRASLTFPPRNVN
jgi:hypothetical protein